MKQIRFALFAILLAACLAPAAASAEYMMYWKKSEASGSFTDETMWTTADGGSTATPDFDKGAERWFRIFTKAGGSNTVQLGDYNMLGALWAYVWGDDATHWYYYDYSGTPEDFKERSKRFLWLGPTRVYFSIGYDLIRRKK